MHEKLDIPDAEIYYSKAFFVPTDCKFFFKHLRKDLPWKELEIQVFGKTHKQPRLTSWHGDPGTAYTYSKMKLDPMPWTETLLEIRRKVNLDAGVKFNSVLANLYRNGNDSMGSHSDDEEELGDDPVIASVSLGATRTFRLKHRKNPEIPKVDLELSDGSLLLMKGSTQQNWKHEVPKISKRVGERINLTFRIIQ